MKEFKIQISQYLNTTRVNVSKINGLSQILNSTFVANQIKDKTSTIFLPFDMYEFLQEKFSRYCNLSDDKKNKGFILFVNGTPAFMIQQREKLWFHRCPDCSTPTQFTPFKDIFECPECGTDFYIKREHESYYI